MEEGYTTFEFSLLKEPKHQKSLIYSIFSFSLISTWLGRGVCQLPKIGEMTSKQLLNISNNIIALAKDVHKRRLLNNWSNLTISATHYTMDDVNVLKTNLQVLIWSLPSHKGFTFSFQEANTSFWVQVFVHHMQDLKIYIYIYYLYTCI